MRGMVVAIWASVLAPGFAFGQGIDCSKARSPTEKAICGSPNLVALDRQVGAAYADAVARRPEQAAALRSEQLSWIRSRDAACTVPMGQIGRCLTGQLTARLEQLAPPPAVTPVAGPTSTLAPMPTVREVAVPSASNPPAPAATLLPAAFAAAEETSAELRVTSPGRFTIVAQSASGAAVQLVDQLTGPGEIMGEAGARDGRLDALLDVGIYRVRAFAAKGAVGEVQLQVRSFHDADPARALPLAGTVVSAELRDGEQRGFWLVVPPSGEVSIEAAGRGLADLRLWRNGRELTGLSPAAASVEPAPGHVLTDLRLTGKAEPGVYLVIAYGGPALPWADGSPAMPFHVRSGLSDSLAEGWAGGAIGPFGSERYRAPAFAGAFRLDLPQPADAVLRVDQQSAALAKTGREPSATVFAEPGKVAFAEVRGAAGQRFTLRATARSTVRSITRPGRYFVSALALGAGGDEPPATVLLQRTDPKEPARIVASTLPVLAPGAPWHGRFNLRGPTALLFQNAVGGPVSLTTSGVPLGSVPATTSQYDVPADTYVVRLQPGAGAQGVIDVAVGPPGPPGALVAPLPPDPSVPLGIQDVGPGQSLQLSAQSSPGLQTGLIARPVPVALAEGPLFITQAAGAAPITVPVILAAGGSLSASELGGAEVAVADDRAGEVHTLTVPRADRPRTVVLAWRRAVVPANIPAPPAEASVPTLAQGQAVPFDLARGEQRGFALTVSEGGLYRVETLGRLHVSGTLASAFVPQLGAAEANGTGENMLIQSWLRAGRYRVDVMASDSAGHLAIRAAPAPLATGATLVAGSSVRATMAAGAGVAFPVTVAEDGRYQLDLLSLGQPFTVRLDDAEGWPVTVPGPQNGLDVNLRKGTYRLLVSPEPVERRVVARLERIVPAAAIVGHGPHRLPFGAVQAATWREPAGRDAARTPDVWQFDLAGPAAATLSLADGMIGELRNGDRLVVRFTRRWTGRLEGGAYRVEAASLGRNDRLDYTIGLTTEEIQPGEVRSIALPATVPFALAEARVVTLTSWGTTPVKAVLRRADGSEVVRAGARVDDWNLALSRPLPAGAYRLELAAAAAAAGGRAVPRDPGMVQPVTSDDASDSDTKEGDDSKQADADDQTAQTAPARESDSGSSASENDDASAPTVALRLALPAAAAIAALPIEAAGPGTLVAASAASAGAAVLTLERQAADGWSVVALDQGSAPMVAASADASGAAWRVRAWPVDGADPVSARAAVVDMAAQTPGGVALRRVDELGLFAGHVRAAAGPFDVAGAALAAGWPGHAASAVEGGQAVVQGADLWLLALAEGTASATPMRLDAVRTVTVPAGGSVALPALAAGPGRVRVWQAEAGAGSPVFVGVGARAVARNGAIAAADSALSLVAAGADVPVRLTPLDLALLPEAGPGDIMLPAHAAVPVRVPGPGRVALALAAGTGALTGNSGAWAGDGALARDLFAAGVVTLVNLTEMPAPVALRWTAETPWPALAAGLVSKRFFGAAGSFEVPIMGPGTVAIAGEGALLLQMADGRLRRGRTIAVEREGTLVVTHGTGAVAVSMTAPGVSPWPSAAPQDLAIPGAIALEGAAMALTVQPAGPALLHATTTAPVLLGLGDAPPELFAAGAEFHRTVPGGATILRLYPPQDGNLSGTLAVAAEPIRPAQEGVGEAVAVAPGQSAAFGFTLARAATIGVGVRAEPDQVEVRLLDARGTVLGEGVAQLQALPAGRYVLEARVPPDAPATTLRPALVGIAPRGNGPPPDVVQGYLELVGLAPVETGK